MLDHSGRLLQSVVVVVQSRGKSSSLRFTSGLVQEMAAPKSAVEQLLSMDEFQVGHVIGKGQFSVVYQAAWKCDSAPVALKKVKLFGIFDSKARADCIQEIEILKKLQHDNVIRYVGSFEDDNDLLIVLELADAGDLAKLLFECQRRGKLLSEASVWSYFDQICSAVEHIHSKRIVHRGKLKSSLISRPVVCLPINYYRARCKRRNTRR